MISLGLMAIGQTRKQPMILTNTGTLDVVVGDILVDCEGLCFAFNMLSICFQYAPDMPPKVAFVVRFPYVSRRGDLHCEIPMLSYSRRICV